MKTEELKEKGLTDEQIQFVMAENGKDVNRLKGEKQALEADRDDWKNKFGTAEETLKKFEGFDVEGVKAEIEKYKNQLSEAEQKYKDDLYNRDYAAALDEAMNAYEFTSTFAKRAVIAEIKEKKLPMSDGKILGLADLIEQIKEKDASAFKDDDQEDLEKNKKRFTDPKKKDSQKSLKEMTLDERMALKRNNPDMYAKLKNN